MIEIIGVGGCGGNIGTTIYNETEGKVIPLFIDTDIIMLENRPSDRKVHLKGEDYQVYGTGGIVETGSTLASANISAVMDKIKKDAYLYIVIAGLGGGTGTGASPLIVKQLISLKKKVLMIGIMPFTWEGSLRINKSKNASYELLSLSSGFIQFSNNKLQLVSPQKNGLLNKINSVISSFIVSFIRSFNTFETKRIDLSDFLTIMKNGSKMLYGAHLIINTKESISTELKKLWSCYCEQDLFSATTLGVLFQSHPSLGENIISDICLEISENMGSSLREFLYGILYDEKISPDLVKISLIAGGINGKNHESSQTNFLINFNNFSPSGGFIDELRKIKKQHTLEQLEDIKLNSKTRQAPNVLPLNSVQKNLGISKENPFIEENKKVD